jgi:hypothetical protein
MIGLTDVLKSPSVWTGKDGVTGVTDLLKNPPLQDKIQLGLMKTGFDTLVKTGQIITPGTDLKAPTGQLYDAAANAGKSLISASAGLLAAPKALSSLPTNALSDIGGLASGATGALSGALSGATGALSGAVGNLTGGGLGVLAGGITGNLGSVSALANKGTAQLGGLLANAGKFGVDNAVSWAKGASGATGAIAGITGSLTGAAAGVTGALSGAASGLTSGLKTQMDSLAKQGQFAVNFSDFKLPAAVAGIVPAAGFKGTVDRSTLNAATAKLIGSDKIDLPSFSPQALDTSALTNAASKAKGLLSGGLDAGGLLSKASGALGGLGGIGALGGLAAGALGGSGLGGLASNLGTTLGTVTGIGALASSTDSIARGRAGLNPDPGATRFADASKALALQEEYEKLIAKVGRSDPRAQALLAEIRALLATAGA